MMSAATTATTARMKIAIGRHDRARPTFSSSGHGLYFDCIPAPYFSSDRDTSRASVSADGRCR